MNGRSVTIYFDSKFKCFQIINPGPSFNGNWRDLVDAVTVSGTGHQNYYRWVVK